MTHNPDKPMKESEGDFTTVGDTVRECRGCKQRTTHTVQQWDSHDGAYEDFKYTCIVCGAVHWVDGDDG
jgi:hypothetical protein